MCSVTIANAITRAAEIIAKAMKEIRIVINCDEGFVADTLREIATQYENGGYAQFGFYEAEHGVGTIEETE
jgi:hypothetical protein